MYDVDYYKRDKRFGERCLCDGINLYEAYNADLVSYQYTRGKLTTEYQQEPGLSGLLFFGSEFAVGELGIVFYVGGADRDDVDKNVSGLVEATKNCVLNFGTSTLEYVCILSEISSEYTEVHHYQEVTLTLTAVRRGGLITVKSDHDFTVINPGDTPSGVRYTIEPTRDIAEFSINGTSIRNLKIGERVIIDGMRGTVSQEDGTNRFMDTNLTSFPVVQPGENRIVLSNPVPVTVEFYPVYA